jgi:hypothetical protein
MLCVQTHTRIHLTPVLQKGSVINVGNLDTVGLVISALQKKQNARNVGLWDTTKPSRVKWERFDKKKGKGNTKNVKKVDGDKKRDSALDDSNAEEKSELVFQVTYFHVHKVSGAEDLVEVSVGSVPVKALIDSGAMVNVIDKKEWDRLKKAKVKCVSYLTNQKLYVYGSKEPLSVLGAFHADVCK